MITNQKIKEAVRSLNYDKLKIGNLFICTVSDNSKAETAHTVDGTTLNADGSSSGILGIRLNPDPNDSFLVVPSNGSTIFVIMTTNKEYYLCNWSDIDKFICQLTNTISLIGDKNGWIFNDGNNHGLIKIISLISKLNNIENYLNALFVIFSGLTPSGSETGLAAMKVSILAASTQIKNIGLTIQSDLEDTLVKH